MMDKIFDFIEQNRNRFVDELLPFIAQPSISATGEGVQACAEYLAKSMRQIGIETQLLPAGKYPIVYGEILSPLADKTLVLLCHYDVVPPGPLENWLTPPFEPVIKNNRIWGRGAGDNKGQLFAGLKALESWMTVVGDLPINIRLVYLGDEEIGSPTLSSTVQNYRSLFRGDAVLFADASTLDVWGPVVYLGNRGALALELTARGAERPAHSGSYGGLLRNPALRLAQAVASLRDLDGRILIPGFYDDLRPIGNSEKDLLSHLKLERDKKLESLGADEFWGDPGYDYFETQMYRPTLNIHGLTSGYQDEGWMAMVPAIARAKIDINLVPDLDPDDLKIKIRKHLDEQGFGDISLDEIAREQFAVASLPDDAFLKIMSQAQERVWGKKPIIYPSIGGGGNIVKAFKDVLEIPHFLLVPLGQPDMNEHSPFENLDVEWYVRGIQTIAAVIGEFAKSRG